MEPARDAPWAEHEKVRAAIERPSSPNRALLRADHISWKVYLLAEILKAAPIPSHVLLSVIRDYNIQPRWNEMSLPTGTCTHSLRDGAAMAVLAQLRAHNSNWSNVNLPLLLSTD
jgi:hypothetical protein